MNGFKVLLIILNRLMPKFFCLSTKEVVAELVIE